MNMYALPTHSTAHFVHACTLCAAQVTKVELLLNYEGGVSHPLAIGSMDNFLLELAVHPATLQVGARDRWEGT
jgi:hypothetical protein